MAAPTPLSRRAALLASACAAAGTLWPGRATAQSSVWPVSSIWPAKPIRRLVPFAPGGSSESVARAPAAELSKSLGQSV